jgi:hypothetical protein
MLMRPHLDPRAQPTYWGNMLWATPHWRPGTGAAGGRLVDADYQGEGCHSAIGMLYLMSCVRSGCLHTGRSLTCVSRKFALAARLAMSGTDSRRPRAVSYPYDDMLVGTWVTDYVPGTEVADDAASFHNPLWHGGKSASQEGITGWDSVVVHHVGTVEIAALRVRPEWEMSGTDHRCAAEPNARAPPSYEWA